MFAEASGLVASSPCVAFLFSPAGRSVELSCAAGSSVGATTPTALLGRLHCGAGGGGGEGDADVDVGTGVPLLARAAGGSVAVCAVLFPSVFASS